jgi:hypothetical protein
MVTMGKFIGLRRLSMSTEKHFHVMEFQHILMIDGDESQSLQTFTLHTVVDDITETIEGAALLKFFLCLADGGGHTEAEATTVVDFYFHIFLLFTVYSLRFTDDYI